MGLYYALVYKQKNWVEPPSVPPFQVCIYYVHLALYKSKALFQISGIITISVFYSFPHENGILHNDIIIFQVDKIQNNFVCILLSYTRIWFKLYLKLFNVECWCRTKYHLKWKNYLDKNNRIYKKSITATHHYRDVASNLSVNFIQKNGVNQKLLTCDVSVFWPCHAGFYFRTYRWHMSHLHSPLLK